MYCFRRLRITTIIYFCFLTIFFGSFLVLTSLNKSIKRENETKKQSTRLEVSVSPFVNEETQPTEDNDSFAELYTWCQPLHFIPDAESRPVTALVSFPGSGNTWLRYLIQQSTGILTGSYSVDQELQMRGFPGEPVSNASVAVVKVHEWGQNVMDKFQKAVLLIRQPKPAIQSLFNLYQGGGHVGIASQTLYQRNNGKDWRDFFNVNIKIWKATNLDWIKKFKGPLHIVLYDQLREDLGPTLRSLGQFLDLPVDETALQCTVEHSEGLYHRPPRTDNFDPFTEQMKKLIAEVEHYVFKQIQKYLMTQSASYDVSLLSF